MSRSSPIHSAQSDAEIEPGAGLSSLDETFRTHYPLVCRVACALCGSIESGRRAVRQIMSKSPASVSRWRNDSDARNWFLHHTIIETRLSKAPSGEQDSLLRGSSPAYAAFIRALRHLPPQQREAFILARCERLDPRLLAVAMDCSTTAAANHLVAAQRTLGEISATDFDTNLQFLQRVYASFTPPEELILDDVARAVRRCRRKKLTGFLRMLVKLAILAGIAWTIWRISRMIVI